MRYEAVLFDMDGTVLDTLRDLNAAANRALGEFGFPPMSLDDTRRRVGNGSRRLLELSVPEGTSGQLLEEILAWYLPYYNLHANDCTAPYAGICELLHSIRACGIAMAIVSNKPDRTVKELAQIHFPDLFTCAVGEDEAHGVRRKPAPDTLLSAAEQLGKKAGDCLYVGDSEVDILTASRAGMDCASVLWGFRSREELESAGAKLLFESPSELERYIVEK